MHTRFILVLALLGCTFLYAQDWSGIPVPANPGAGKVWQLQGNHSDDFNYTGKPAAFTNKWKDTYFNGWTGPGLTYWNPGNTWVADGNLIVEATRRSGTNKVNCGVITSKTKISYPVYTEARIRVSNLELSSNFWLLSDDDKREIDILEVYGGASQVWFARNMSTNFHVFFRNAQNQITSDYNDQNHVTLPGNAFWRSDFHRFGVYWKSPTEVDFYIDGKKTADGSWAQSVMVDKDYTGATLNKNVYNMDRAKFMIIDMEDHAWRSNQGIVADDASLRDNNRNKMYVDWVRTYKPVNAPSTGGGGQTVANGTYFIKSPFRNENLGAFSWNGHDARTINAGTFTDQKWDITHLGNNVYHVRNVGTGRYLEVPYARCGNGQDVKTWTSGSGNHQRWFIEKINNAYFFRPNHCRSQALDRPYGRANADCGTYAYSSGNANLKWNLARTSKNFVETMTTPLNKTDELTYGLQAFPNPTVAGNLNLRLTLPQDGPVDIRVFDAAGRNILHMDHSGVAGQSVLNVGERLPQRLTPGVYLVTATSDGQRLTERVVIR